MSLSGDLDTGRPATAGMRADQAGRKQHAAGSWSLYDVALWILIAGLASYNLFPSAALRPVVVEGFEGAVATYVNDLVMHGWTAMAPYQFDNRPGEYLLYRLLASTLKVDALLIGQAISVLSYLVGGAATVFLSIRLMGSSLVAAAISFLLLFEVAASAALVSSSNISAGLVLAAFALIARSTSIGFLIASSTLLAAATFTRLDSFLAIPFLLPCLAARDGIDRDVVLRSALAAIAALLLAWAFYRLAGIDPVGELVRASTQETSWTSIRTIVRELARMVMPFLLPFALAGCATVWWWDRDDPVRRLARLCLVIGPFLLFAVAYRHKPETPRFFIIPSMFLALGAARFITSFEPWMRRGVKNAALAVVLVIGVGFLCGALRVPYYPWDGYRYSVAPFLSPYTLSNEKRYVARTADKLTGALLKNFGAEEKTIVFTSWPMFFQALRELVAAGGQVVTSDTDPFFGLPVSFHVGVRLGNRTGEIRLIQRDDHPLTDDQLATVVSRTVTSGRSIQILTEHPDIAALLRGTHPTASISELGEFKPFPHMSLINIEIGPNS